MAFRDARAKQAPAVGELLDLVLQTTGMEDVFSAMEGGAGAAGESAAAARAGVCLFRHWKSEPDGLLRYMDELEESGSCRLRARRRDRTTLCRS